MAISSVFAVSRAFARTGNMDMTRIVFGVSGASGMPLSINVLAMLAGLPGLEIHLIISEAAKCALEAECGLKAHDLGKYAHCLYSAKDMGAAPASGSWPNCGMIVCPCSMSSLAAIAQGVGTTLLHRAADVALKERRPLLLVARETPLSLVHLRNMCAATEAGAIIMPFVPAFYTGENSLEAAMRQFTGRMLDLLHIPHSLCKRWKEVQA